MKRLFPLLMATVLFLVIIAGVFHLTAAASINLINNPSAETLVSGKPANWTADSWGTSTTTMQPTTDAHTGTTALNITSTARTSGDAKWTPDAVAITGGQQYTYSGSYKSSVATELDAAYTDANGVTTYEYIGAINASTGWTQANATFTAPATARKVSILHILATAGSLTIDDVSLSTTGVVTPPVPPTPPAPTPLTIANPSVETSTDGINPDNWEHGSWGTNNATFSYSSDAHTGAKSVKTTITSYTDGDAKWAFAPVTGLRNGDSYRFSTWIKASAQVHAVAAFTMADGTVAYVTLTLPVGTSPTTWMQYATSFTAPTGAQSMTVYMLLSSTGWVETDDYSLSTYVPTGFAKGLVSLNFDDGWRNIYTNGLPLLTKYNLPSTQYIISGKIGIAGYMTKAQIKAFQAQGSEIGSHGVTHSDLTTVTAAQLTPELSQSQATLRRNFGNSVATEFATPYGSYNASVLAGIKKYYVSHRSTDVGFNSKDSFNPYNIVVQNVKATTTNAQVKAWVDQALAQKTWLVLVYHQVENQVAAADTDAVKTSDLNTQLSYIKSSGITVKTQAAALTEVTAQLQ